MIHKNCGGNIVMDLSGMYLINSPGLNITTKGIFPGMLQVDTSPEKRHIKLLCSKCGDSFSTKEEFESGIVDVCDICGKERSPSEIRITDYIPKICDNCIDNENSAKLTENSIQKRIFSLYGEVLHKIESSTLLTILLKKL